MFEQLWSGARVITQKRFTSQSIKSMKKTTTELPKRGLLVYCNTGQRARFAAEKLEDLGFKDVYYIAGHYSSLL